MDKIEQEQALHDHFHLFYERTVAAKLSKNAQSKKLDGAHCYLSGIPWPMFNAVIVDSPPRKQGDEWIRAKASFFQRHRAPFVFYVDEGSTLLDEALAGEGFQCLGLFQGMVGTLGPTPPVALSGGVSLERVKDERAMEAFAALVGETFGMPEPVQTMCQTLMWNEAQGSHPLMAHWLARVDGRPASTLTTMVRSGCYSFWNAATLPEFRKQGINTALWTLGVEDARSRGCSLVTSYLMHEALAFGICSKLGLRPRWRFKAYLPKESSQAP